MEYIDQPAPELNKAQAWRHRQLRFLKGYYSLVIADIEAGSPTSYEWLDQYRDRLNEIERELESYEN